MHDTFLLSKIQQRLCPKFLRLRFSISAIIKWVKTLECRACSLWNSSIVYFYTRLLYWRSWGHVVLSVKRNSCLYLGLRLLFWHKSWACFQICPFLTFRNCSLNAEELNVQLICPKIFYCLLERGLHLIAYRLWEQNISTECQSQ